MKNYYSLSFALGFLILVGLACGGNAGQNGATSNTTSAPPAASPGNSAKPANENQAPPVAALKWSDYDKVYSVKSNSTDAQKEALWKDFEGKVVTWQGTVTEAKEGMMGGLTVQIKMNPDTITSDIILTLKEGQKEKMMSLTKGQKITFTGRLKNPGGAVLPLSMDEGEVK